MSGGGWSNWGNWIDCHVPSSPYLEAFGRIMYYRCGLPDCEGGEGAWYTNAVCLENAVIRYARAGRSDQFSDVLSACYWMEKVGCPEHCYVEETFDLDVYIGRVTNHQTGFFHAICAEYLGGDVRIITNWRFFQYSNTNIPPGRDWQIPAGVQAENTKLEIFEVTGIPDCGHYDKVDPAEAIFLIDPQGNPQCTYPPP
jgi:hypothetical protein